MKYCSECGSEVEYLIPEGDNLKRYVCTRCDNIHYQNPRIIAGCIPILGDKVLLCRRAIEPRYGLWTLPAGFMENNETTEQAATRETWEEARAKVKELTLYGLYSVPHISQVYLLYRGNLVNADFSPGIESLETRLFSEDEIPWDKLAFPVIHQSLTHFFSEYKQGNFTLHTGDILRNKS
ncbi:MAG: NUDIX hydrolase [Gammaproteobacteria bacterium]|nr:NUDIX hydrolase [Gammaproteobacteria bacterium]